MEKLRDYQKTAIKRTISAWKTEDRILISAATGTGKSTIITGLLNELYKKKGSKPKIVMLVHRDYLCTQLVDRINKNCKGLLVSIEAGKLYHDPNSDIVIASNQTIGRKGTQRLSNFVPDYVIIDEAHHACADTYQRYLEKVGCFNGKCKLLGVTATAHRLDNKRLVNLTNSSETHTFNQLVFNYTISEAILDSWLVAPVGYRKELDFDLSKVKTTAGDYNQKELDAVINTGTFNAEAAKIWNEVAAGKRTVCFCVSISHAEEMADCFRALGYVSKAIHSKMDDKDREQVLQDFYTGNIDVLTNVNVVTEGFDVPAVECILMLRPTQSWVYYVQAIGRGLRICPEINKKECLIIDIVSNSSAHSIVTLPEALGLPRKIVIQNGNYKDLLLQWNMLTEEQKEALRNVVFTGTDLKDMAEQIDLLFSPEYVEEVKDNKLAWSCISDDEYKLYCFDVKPEYLGLSTKNTDFVAEIFLKNDPIFGWRLKVIARPKYSKPPHKYKITVKEKTIGAFNHPSLAIEHAEDWLYLNWSSLPISKSLQLKTLEQAAPWRKANASEAQINYLVSKGFSKEKASTLKKGEIALAIDMANSIGAVVNKRNVK